MSDTFLFSFNFQSRSNDNFLDIVSQHESPTYHCSSYNYYGYKLDGDCPYIGRQLLQKVSKNYKSLYILVKLLVYWVISLVNI